MSPMKIDGAMCKCGRPAVVGLQGKPSCLGCFEGGLRDALKVIDTVRQILDSQGGEEAARGKD